MPLVAGTGPLSEHAKRDERDASIERTMRRLGHRFTHEAERAWHRNRDRLAALSVDRARPVDE